MSRHRYVKNINTEEERETDTDMYDVKCDEDITAEDLEMYISHNRTEESCSLLLLSQSKPQGGKKPRKGKGKSSTVVEAPVKKKKFVVVEGENPWKPPLEPAISNELASEPEVMQLSSPRTPELSQEEDSDSGKEEKMPVKSKEEKTPPIGQEEEKRPEMRRKKDLEAIEAAYANKFESGKQSLNLVVVGHVDAGKSTMMGHVLFQLGFVTKNTIRKYEKEAHKIGKGSFAYAWVLDETEEERARGVTMDIAETRFHTRNKSITLLDAPGHKDFVPNMITGAAQADAAVLVINATTGEFETGFSAGGQTQEHAMLIRSLGISQLIVAINKMDTVGYKRTRYDEIITKLESFLKKAGFYKNNVKYVPCSGLLGQNLAEPATAPELKSWYSGHCLTDLIDTLTSPKRPYQEPFRQCITDIYRPKTSTGTCICVAGTIQAGCVQPGDKVRVMPHKEISVVKSVLINELQEKYAFAGDNATLVLQNIDQEHLSVGNILCDPASPIPTTTRIQAKIVIFNFDGIITKGFPTDFHYQSLQEPAVITKLVSQLNRNTGEVLKKKPRMLCRHTSAIVEIKLKRPVCIELFNKNKDLGRFMLRYLGSTIAAGCVQEIRKPKQLGRL